MDKEIQRIAWSCLPKEFKEEVKKLARLYSGRTSALFGAERHLANKFLDEFIGLFGRHNLTSDAEGEEMLTCEKSKVRQVLDYCNTIDLISSNNNMRIIGYRILESLFGPKCLPDEAQPKQKDCDNPLADKEGCRWRNDGKCAFDSACYFEPLNPQESQSAEPKEVTKMKPIESKVSVYLATKEEDKEFRQLLHNNGFKWNASIPLINFAGWSSSFEDSKIHCIYPDKIVACYGKKTSNTLTFSEFKKQYFGEEDSPNVNNSDIDIDEIVAKGYLPDPAKQFDAILKDSFSKERRLNIAAMAMQGILSAPLDNVGFVIDKTVNDVAVYAVRCADALIAELNKKKDGR